MDNVKVFKDTMKKIEKNYKKETEELKKNVVVYSDACALPVAKNSTAKMAINFINMGTVATAYSLKTENNRVAMLNFADAKRPGGWVEEGAPTQEENICRCTNIYPALHVQKCIDGYYKKNNVSGTDEHLVESYTNALIYLPDALIFKDDVKYTPITPKHVDVITSPAPCGYFPDAEKIILYRAYGIIKSAIFHGVTDIVLGAWGCGVFGQDPIIVAKCFATVLKDYPVFNSVTFAIRNTEGSFSKTNITYILFKNAFERYYK